MARQMSPMLLGREIEGIWHSGVVVYDRECVCEARVSGGDE